MIHHSQLSSFASTKFSRPAFRSQQQVPIVYSDLYDLKLTELRHKHNLNFSKRKEMFERLGKALDFQPGETYSLHKLSAKDLLRVHSPAYLSQINDPNLMAEVMGLEELRKFDKASLETKILQPMRAAVAGTLQATKLAIKHGWSLNLAGGSHHASRERAEALCVYDDVAIAVRHLQAHHPEYARILIVDLDAHNANGTTATLKDDPTIKILDIFNEQIYPVKFGKDVTTELSFAVHSTITDSQYAALLLKSLLPVLDDFAPQIVFYNAGLDVIDGDPWGRMHLSLDAVIKRDRFVFNQVTRRNIPLATVISGGYSRGVATILEKSWRAIRAYEME